MAIRRQLLQGRDIIKARVSRIPSIMPEQQAILLREVGKQVELGKRSVPIPATGQVKIKVTSTMRKEDLTKSMTGNLLWIVLPHDAYSRQFGLFVGDKLPWVLGANLAGQVVEVGVGVSKTEVGDRVFGLEHIAAALPDGGGLQTYALLNEDALAKIPAGFTDDEVTTLPINAVTSFMAFFTKFGFDLPAPWTEESKSHDSASDSVVIIAAGSNVGKLGVQYAKLAGFGKIICTAALSNKEELESYGATDVIDRHIPQEEIVAQIHAIAGKEGVTKIYDCYSWTFELGLDILSTTKSSRLVTLHSHRGDTPNEIKTKRPLTIANYVPCSNTNLAPHTAGFWDHIVTALENRTLFPTSFRIIEGLDVERINEALDVYWAAKPQKQVIVHP